MKGFRSLAFAALMIPSIAFAAENPFAGVQELLHARRHQEAREQLVKVRDTFAAQQDATNEAIAWLLLGVTDTSLDQGVAARMELDQAASKFIALDDHFSAAIAVIALASLERSGDRLTDAVAAYERAFALFEKAADPKSHFSIAVLEVVGPASGMSLQMPEALANYPEILKPIVLGAAGFAARDAYAGVLIEAGDLEKAEAQLTLASNTSMLGGVFGASVDVHFGDLRQRQWRLDEARESYVKALRGSEIARAFGVPGNDLSILGKLAKLELLAGRVDEALTWNDRALKSVRNAKDGKGEGAILEDRASLLQRAGRFDDALALYGDVMALALEIGDSDREASVHYNLGELYMFRSLYGSSARHLQKAIELYQQLDQPYVEAVAWVQLANVQMQLGMHDDVTAALDNACDLATRTDFRLVTSLVDTFTEAKAVIDRHGTPEDLRRVLGRFAELSEARSLLAEEAPPKMVSALLGMKSGTSIEPEGATIRNSMMQMMPELFRGAALSQQGDQEGARGAWRKALEVNQSGDIRAALLAAIGSSHWNEGRRDEGISYFVKAADALNVSIDDIKVEEMLAGFLGGDRRKINDLLVDLLAHERRGAEAFAQTERSRARAFLQMVGNHRLNAERGADQRLVEEAEILRTEINAREWEMEQAHGEKVGRLATDLDLARQRYRRLLTQVKISNPEYGSLTTVEPLQLEEVRAELPPDVTLISYFISLNAVYAWVIDRNEVHFTGFPINGSSLAHILCWARQFGPPADARGLKLSGPCDGAATAEDAFDRLIKPLLGVIHQRKLILVPHGVLHYVPFAALRNRETGRYLIDDYTLTYLPSASALRFLRAKESPVDGGSLILGDPENAMTRLPGAAEEATAIARMLRATPHLGAEARESMLYAANGKIDLVHLAAHGVYDPRNPLFSKIALAKDETEDGNLTVDEILSTLDLTGVNLVVLSACQSAVGARSGGDEVVGLTRALLYAGTPGVISTLWNIDDAASAGLMREFYRRLTGGASVAEALRQAQLAVKENERFSDPKYWAAFMLTGDPQGRWKRAD